jgi:beta-glucanase (GH16 family)
MFRSLASSIHIGNQRWFIVLLIILALTTTGFKPVQTSADKNPQGSLTALALPGAFNKSSPANGAVSQPNNPTLKWTASSGATRYEYCLDTSNNNTCNKAWVSTGSKTNVNLTGLIPGITYYWQVRAVNATGITYANGSKTAWWHFTITRPATGKWTLVWRDEFNGSGGLSASKWKYDLGKGIWGTGEIEEMTNSLSNVFQSGGILHIRALHQGTNPIEGWTSGRIETIHTDFEPPAGGGMAVESRIRLPNVKGSAAKGYWPAFWMLGEACRGDRCDWPKVGEIDIMENINGLNTWWGTFHCGIYPGGPCNEPSGVGGNSSGFSPDLQSDYHVYRLEFDKSSSPQQLRWYVDGNLLFTLDSSHFDATTWKNATNHGFFIIFDLAIGGNWAGKPIASTSSGGTMLVDYVRVYVRSGH